MTEDVAVYFHEDVLAHHPTGWDPDHPEWTEAVQALLAEVYPDKDPESWTHPERPDRVSAIRNRLLELELPYVSWRSIEEAGVDSLVRVHTNEHVAFVDSLKGRSCWLSVDTTAVSPESVRAARLAAGSGVAAVDDIARGNVKRAFCLVRPPGHHALPDRAMGFCLFNNAAVAAAHALACGRFRRILLYDWDLHHGNGTQEIFYDHPDVLFIDTHCEAPFYPGTGLLEETGRGEGEGRTINVPLPAGSGNSALLSAAERILTPAAERFGPDLVIVSAGFDPHFLDQTMALDESGFGHLCARMAAIAERHCGGRLVLMLEGGYHADALASGAEACVRAMGGETLDDTEQDNEDPGLPAVEAAAAFHDLV